MKYTVLKDISIFGITVTKSGDVLSVDSEGNCDVMFNGTTISVNISELPKDTIKKMEDLNIGLRQLSDDNQETPSTWRLQLDVTTTSTNAKKIEKFLRETLPNMI